jgi:hypothetical protein
MKKAPLAAVGILILLIASCQSKPKPVPSATPAPTATPTPAPSPTPSPTPEATPSPEPSLEPSPVAVSFDEEKARAEELRAKCFDYGLNELLKDDYDQAMALYNSGLSSEADAPAEAKDLYAQSAQSFEALLSNGLAAIVSDLIERVDFMRSAAEEKLGESSSPDQMNSASAEYEAGKAAADSGDMESAIPSLRSALARYEIAYERSRAVQAKEDIDTRGFEKFDAGNYALASAKLEESDAAFADDLPASLDAVQEALLRYNLVIKAGWELALGAKRTDADSLRQKADGIKAARAAMELYAAAQSAYEEGLGYEAEEKYDFADEAYTRSSMAFADAYDLASQKRDRAQAALDAIQKSQDRSQAKAASGDARIKESAGSGEVVK